MAVRTTVLGEFCESLDQLKVPYRVFGSGTVISECESCYEIRTFYKEEILSEIVFKDEFEQGVKQLLKSKNIFKIEEE